MYVVANRIPAAPEHEGRARQHDLLQHADEVNRAPGFVRMEMRRPPVSSDETSCVVLMHWTDKAAFEAWTDQHAHLVDQTWSKSA